MPTPARPSEDRSRWLVLTAVTALALYICWKMVQPFLTVILWAGVLALLFAPVQKRLTDRFRRPGLAAAVTLLLVIATVILPLGLITGALVNEISAFASGAPERFEKLLADPAVGGRLRGVVDMLDERFALSEKITPEAFQEHLGGLGQNLVRGTFNVLGGALGALVNLLFILFALFFLLRDGERAVGVLQGLVPLEPAETGRLFARTRDIIHASVYGVLVISAIQGTLGGLIFAVLGIPSALLWGVVMALLSILPMVGSGLVWAPAALVLAATGSWGKAIVLALFGALVIGSVDNFLRPKLVGERAKMHELTIFFAVLGGLKVFGVLGLLFGPVVFALTASLFDVFRRGSRGTAAEAAFLLSGRPAGTASAVPPPAAEPEDRGATAAFRTLGAPPTRPPAGEERGGG